MYKLILHFLISLSIIVACVETVIEGPEQGSDLQNSMERNKFGEMLAEGGTSSSQFFDMNTAEEQREPLDQSLGSTVSLDMAREVSRCEPLIECSGACVDLSNDLNHCGGCDQRCDIANGSATCRRGQCAVDACAPNYYDIDRNPVNGCEVFDRCTPNQPCLTQCQSNGLSQCSQGQSQCVPPAESCTLSDDDCDGRCDEQVGGLTCTVGIHRAYADGYHLYSSDPSVISARGYSIEVSSYFELYQRALPDTEAVYLCLDQMDRASLKSSSGCDGGTSLGLLGYWSTQAKCGSSPLYGMRHPSSGNLFYTIDPAEVDYAIATWSYQELGVVGYVW